MKNSKYFPLKVVMLAVMIFVTTSFSIRTLNFSGYIWDVKGGSNYQGPGTNIFSSSNNSVWVDSNGYLHLTILYNGTTWLSSEVYTQKNLGYGTYTFGLASNISNLDKNVVLGMFTWNNDDPKQAYSEIDMEVAKWGNDITDSTNLQDSVQPTNNQLYTERWNRTTMPSGNTTNIFDWTPSQVNFLNYANNELINNWTLTNNTRLRPVAGKKSNEITIPAPENNTQAHINLWLFDNTGSGHGTPPSNGQPVEIIIKSFTFTPN